MTKVFGKPFPKIKGTKHCNFQLSLETLGLGQHRVRGQGKGASRAFEPWVQPHLPICLDLPYLFLSRTLHALVFRKHLQLLKVVKGLATRI